MKGRQLSSSVQGKEGLRKGSDMAKSLIVAGLSTFLLLGIVAAVVLNLNHSHKLTDETSTSLKAISTICAPTDHKDLCVDTLSSGNSSSDPRELIKAAFKATLDQMKLASELPDEFVRRTNGSKEEATLSTCKELLQYAIAELESSYSAVGEKELHTIGDRVNEIRNWLSAVLAYQETCKDDIRSPELKSAMADGLLNATKLTSNALAIISEISTILSNFSIPFNLSSTTSRSILEHSPDLHQVDDQGYPTWFSARNRRLLALHDNNLVQPNVVVAQDGSGNFKSISDAINAMPKIRAGRYVIYVKAGIYQETVKLTADMTNVFMYGDDPKNTIVTGSMNFVDGTATFETATFAVFGNDFIAKSIGFHNTAGAVKHQAVALNVLGDRSAFFNCNIEGYQDTLYVHSHRQFYRDCTISGTIDFIFGNAAAFIQNCQLIVRKPLDNQYNAVTAQGRTDKNAYSGIVIHNCRIVAEQNLVPMRLNIATYLGRPWKRFSRTIVMESDLGDLIKPEGWMEWPENASPDTVEYVEYGNTGPGASTVGRVKWPGLRVITNKLDALPYAAGVFIEGNIWLSGTGLPFDLGLKK